MRSFETI